MTAPLKKMYFNNMFLRRLENKLSFDVRKNTVNYRVTLIKWFKNLNYKYFVLPTVLIGFDIFCNQNYDNKLFELNNTLDFYNKVQKLQKNKLVLKNLQVASEQFVQYIESIFDKKYVKLVGVKINEPVNSNCYYVTTGEIKGIFIHDKFIFDVLEKLHQYKGFVRIVGINIEKTQLYNGSHVLNTVVACELYTK